MRGSAAIPFSNDTLAEVAEPQPYCHNGRLLEVTGHEPVLPYADTEFQHSGVV